MPCEKIADGPGVTIFACDRSRRQRARCAVEGCPNAVETHCDWPLTGKRFGEHCDRALCALHRKPQPHFLHLRKGKEAVDFCSTHHVMGMSNAPQTDLFVRRSK